MPGEQKRHPPPPHNLTLDGRFNFTNNLGAETVEEADKSSSLGALNAFKCDGVPFNPDPSPLRPNDYLIICIGYLLDGVEIDSLESMVSAGCLLASLPLKLHAARASLFLIPPMQNPPPSQSQDHQPSGNHNVPCHAEVVVTMRLPINSLERASRCGPRRCPPRSSRTCRCRPRLPRPSETSPLST